jgi:hypothetical protein
MLKPVNTSDVAVTVEVAVGILRGV